MQMNDGFSIQHDALVGKAAAAREKLAPLSSSENLEIRALSAIIQDLCVAIESAGEEVRSKFHRVHVRIDKTAQAAGVSDSL